MSTQLSHNLTADQVDALVQGLGGPDQALRVVYGEMNVHLVPAVPATTIERFVTVPAAMTFEDRVARGAFGWRNK